MNSIAVIGAGFVGLTTAACLAELGHNVICSDVNQDRIAQLIHGRIPFFEPDLAPLVAQNMSRGSLRFTSQNSHALQESSIVFICLPTPSLPDGSADTSYIERFLTVNRSDFTERCIIVMKSTVPIGAGNRFEALIARDDCNYVSNPEFLREGRAVHDFQNPDRIVIGSRSREAISSVRNLFKLESVPVVETELSSAEMIKYASNSFLSLKISFINEIAHLCEKAQINVHEVARGIGLDTRIGSAFLMPGPGWGGSCFPKDTSELVQYAHSKGLQLRTVEAAIEANHDQKRNIVEKIVSSCDSSCAQVGILGLAFKAGTDDIRESPAIAIAEAIANRGISVFAFDPMVRRLPIRTLPTTFTHVESLERVCAGSDVLAVLTEWPDFSALDPNQVGKLMSRRVVVDARNILQRRAWEEAGFTYIGVGN